MNAVGGNFAEFGGTPDPAIGDRPLGTKAELQRFHHAIETLALHIGLTRPVELARTTVILILAAAGPLARTVLRPAALAVRRSLLLVRGLAGLFPFCAPALLVPVEA